MQVSSVNSQAVEVARQRQVAHVMTGTIALKVPLRLEDMQMVILPTKNAMLATDAHKDPRLRRNAHLGSIRTKLGSQTVRHVLGVTSAR